MSVASVHPGRSNGSSHREDISRYIISPEPVLSIEELRMHLNSCFTCGVSWQDKHVSLDCSECGGYPLERPCPLCDGHCAEVWERNVNLSHACRKAKWEGCCAMLEPLKQEEENRLCNRLEKLTATS